MDETSLKKPEENSKKLISSYITLDSEKVEDKFVAKEKFCIDSSEVKFYAFYGHFLQWFLVGDGKIEEPIGKQQIHYGDLTKNSETIPIIEELGGEEKVTTSLREAFNLLSLQSNGEEGSLKTNANSCVFFIPDVTNTVRLIRFSWRTGGWIVYACDCNFKYIWDMGARIFFRSLRFPHLALVK